RSCSADASSIHHDLAGHAEGLVEHVGAFERVMAGVRNEGDVAALVAAELDPAALDRAGTAQGCGLEEFLGSEIMAARGGVDEMEHDRLAGVEMNDLGVEGEAGELHLDPR